MEKSCEDTRNATESSNRSWDVPLICKGASALPVCFVQGVQHHHGSQLLAAVMERWPPFSHCGSSKLSRSLRCLKVWRHLKHARTTSNAYTKMGKHFNITHFSQSSSYGSVHQHFAGNVHASVRASGIDKEGSCQTACATSPMCSVVIAATEN